MTVRTHTRRPRPQADTESPQTLVQSGSQIQRQKTSELQDKQNSPWQASPQNWQVNLSNPLAGMYGHGNVASVQAKLEVGQVGDRYEQEADQVASQVVEQIHSSPQSHDGLAPAFDAQELQLRPDVQCKAESNNAVSAPFEQSLQQAKSGGQALNPQLQRSMGKAMGADFSQVKVHTNSRANNLREHRLITFWAVFEG